MDLKIVRIADVGEEKERVILEALAKCDIGKYLLFRVDSKEEGIVNNRSRLVFIFPSTIVDKGDFVSVYTRDGENKVFKNRSNTNTYAFFWNCVEASIWSNNKDKAYLVQYDSWVFKDGTV